jgi:uncharacterized Zn finger protein (UPF0148 family)
MTCTGCEKCETGPVVELMDGRVVCNTCPDWRMECEARSLLKNENSEIRDLLDKRRRAGRKDVDELRAMMLDMRRKK